MSSGFDLQSGALNQLLAFNTFLLFFTFCMQSWRHCRTQKQSSPNLFHAIKIETVCGFLSILCLFFIALLFLLCNASDGFWDLYSFLFFLFFFFLIKRIFRAVLAMD
jgi:hypothetical protein